MVRKIKASEFKARCLKLMDEVQKSGQPIVITKNGQPVSKLVPISKNTIFGALKDTIEIHGDIISPIDVTWEADDAAPRHARSGLDDIERPRARSRGKVRNRKRTR